MKKKNNKQSNKRNVSATPSENKIAIAYHLANQWEKWGLYPLSDDTSFYTALRNGAYVIGYDLHPLNGVIYQNVFHYSNGTLELFSFKPSNGLVLPCKLQRDMTVILSDQALENYCNCCISPLFSGFLVNRGFVFLDTNNIPRSKVC